MIRFCRIARNASPCERAMQRASTVAAVGDLPREIRVLVAGHRGAKRRCAWNSARKKVCVRRPPPERGPQGFRERAGLVRTMGPCTVHCVRRRKQGVGTRTLLLP